jgi:predicted GIY-YIG superfamily endonuclease
MADHHRVYVVELSIPGRAGPCVYVGLTGLSPEARLAEHRRGHRASRHVRRHGVRLRPDLYGHLGVMSYREGQRAERELRRALLARGFCVFGGTR